MEDAMVNSWLILSGQLWKIDILPSRAYPDLFFHTFRFLWLRIEKPSSLLIRFKAISEERSQALYSFYLVGLYKTKLSSGLEYSWVGYFSQILRINVKLMPQGHSLINSCISLWGWRTVGQDMIGFLKFSKNVFRYTSYQIAVPKGLRDGDCAVTEFMCQVSSSTFDTQLNCSRDWWQPHRCMESLGNAQTVCGCGSWDHGWAWHYWIKGWI